MATSQAAGSHLPTSRVIGDVPELTHNTSPETRDFSTPPLAPFVDVCRRRTPKWFKSAMKGSWGARHQLVGMGVGYGQSRTKSGWSVTGEVGDTTRGSTTMFANVEVIVYQ